MSRLYFCVYSRGRKKRLPPRVTGTKVLQSDSLLSFVAPFQTKQSIRTFSRYPVMFCLHHQPFARVTLPERRHLEQT